MNDRESARPWPLLLFVSAAIVFGILTPFVGGIVVGAFTNSARSKTVEVIRYVTVNNSASPQPAPSTAPALTHQPAQRHFAPSSLTDPK
jgi:hypothetical protein